METMTIDQYAAARKLNAETLSEILAERRDDDSVTGSTELTVTELDEVASAVYDTATEGLRDAMESMTDAMAEVAYAREALSAAEAELRQSVQEALGDGVSAVEVARVLGVSRARVYQIRDGKR